MKRIIILLTIFTIVLSSCSSPKREPESLGVNDNSESNITADNSNTDKTVDEDKTQADDNCQKNDIDNIIDKENTDSQKGDSVADHNTENVVDTDLNGNLENSSTTVNSDDQPATQTEPQSSSGTRPFDYYFYTNDNMVSQTAEHTQIIYHGIVYKRSQNGVQFPKQTIYENVDLSTFSETGETAIQKKYNAKGEVLETYEVTILELPESMKNDPYIKLLATKRPTNGSTMIYMLFYSVTNYMGDKLYSIFEANNRYYGSDCLDSSMLDAANISSYEYGENDYKMYPITRLYPLSRVSLNHEQSVKLYSMLCELEYSKNATVDKEKIVVEIDLRFKDGSGETFTYHKEKNLIGCRGYYFNISPEFEDYLLSLFEQ